MVRAWMLAAAMLTATSAYAGPGDLVPRGPDEVDPLVVLDDTRGCARPGTLCFAAGARTTIAVESQVAAAAPAGRLAMVPVVARFARAASLAARDGGTRAEGGAWTLDVASTFKRTALAGNAMFMLFDLDDPEALPNRQFTALYQHEIKARQALSVRLTLGPDDGFRAGHTYRLRIVQLVGGREIPLAEGDVTLL